MLPRWILKWEMRFNKRICSWHWWCQWRLFLWFQTVCLVADFSDLFRILNTDTHHLKEMLLFLLIKDKTLGFLKNNKLWCKHLSLCKFNSFQMLGVFLPLTSNLSMKEIIDILLGMLKNPSKSFNSENKTTF